MKTELLPHLKPQTLVCLSGEVGVGKTEIIKLACHELNFFEVQSPTYAFTHQYLKAGHIFSIFHVDLYRMNSAEDLDSTGFWDLFNQQESILFVEWSNLVPDESWPWNWTRIEIQIEILVDQKRKIKLHFPQV